MTMLVVVRSIYAHCGRCLSCDGVRTKKDMNGIEEDEKGAWMGASCSMDIRRSGYCYLEREDEEDEEDEDEDEEATPRPFSR